MLSQVFLIHKIRSFMKIGCSCSIMLDIYPANQKKKTVSPIKSIPPKMSWPFKNNQSQLICSM